MSFVVAPDEGLTILIEEVVVSRGGGVGDGGSVGDGEGAGDDVGDVACVVADTEALCADVFPATSYAETVYEYEVEGERLVSEYEFDANVPI